MMETDSHLLDSWRYSVLANLNRDKTYENQEGRHNISRVNYIWKGNMPKEVGRKIAQGS